MSYGEGMKSNITRVAIALCVDTSSSMAGEPIKELNKGIELFYDELSKDEVARYSAEISIIEFNSKASIKLPFTEVDSLSGMESQLIANGYTVMGKAIELALNELENQTQTYKTKGVSYYQPWLVIMSDGVPTDDYKKAAERAYKNSANRKLLAIPIGVGEEADLSILSEFSATVPAQKLKDNNFRSFFKWLSASVKNQSRSNQDDHFNMDRKELDWRSE